MDTMLLLTVKEYTIWYGYVYGTAGTSRQAISWRIRHSKYLPDVLGIIKKSNTYLLQVTEECYAYVIGKVADQAINEENNPY